MNIKEKRDTNRLKKNEHIKMCTMHMDLSFFSLSLARVCVCEPLVA